MNNICIIPARANSKRIKSKNIKKFFGKPIIYWSIKAAIKSKCFSKIIVSSDSKKILKISENFGASKNQLRPKKISKDNSTMDEVIKYEIFKENKKIKVDNICCIIATSPLINSKDIKQSFQIFKKNKTDYVFSASTYDAPIQRHFFLDKKGFLINRKMEDLNKGSQDLKKAYHDAGQFYWGSYESFTSKIHIYNGRSIAYYIPPYRCVDINDKDDWKKAEAMFKILKKL